MKRYIRTSIELQPNDAMKIQYAAYGYDAVKIALKYLSDKYDGCELYQDSVDISYQGSLSELVTEIFNILMAAGLPVSRDGSTITYINNGAEELITIAELPEDMDFSLTPDSTGYYISVTQLYD